MKRPKGKRGWKEYALYMESLLYPKEKITIKDITTKLTEYSGFDVLNSSRKLDYLIPRQIAHVIAHKLQLGSLQTIGFEIGKMNHCSVLNSKKQVSNMLETDKQYRIKWQPVINFFGIELEELIIKKS